MPDQRYKNGGQVAELPQKIFQPQAGFDLGLAKLEQWIKIVALSAWLGAKVHLFETLIHLCCCKLRFCPPSLAAAFSPNGSGIAVAFVGVRSIYSTTN